VKRAVLLVFGVGIAIAAMMGRRGARRILGFPVEGMRVTAHGTFGADRLGPPAHSHQGVDLIASPGSHVLAVGDGRIVATQAGLGGIVRKLELDAPAAFAPGLIPVDTLVYADLGTPLVNPGDRVRRGDSIALVGNRGFVHFAVKRGGRFIDPRLAGFPYATSAREVA
jgi:murein DD-endopeptidase MepM/ murein hydrolase activator NlpD